MQPMRPALSPRRRFAWLLWLMLLLPLAQTAATLHVLAHATSDLAGESSRADGKQTIDHARCELCLMAAALIGAAPSGTPPFLAPSNALHTPPDSRFVSVWLAPALPAYQSRAPPFPPL